VIFQHNVIDNCHVGILWYGTSLGNNNGETTVIEAGPEFKVLAKNPLGEKLQASPAISQGQIFIRTEKNLFCIGAK